MAAKKTYKALIQRSAPGKAWILKIAGTVEGGFSGTIDFHLEEAIAAGAEARNAKIITVKGNTGADVRNAVMRLNDKEAIRASQFSYYDRRGNKVAA